MSTHSTPLVSASWRPLALVAVAALALSVGCASAASPVAAPPAEVVKPSVAQSAAAPAPASASAMQGGTIHWLGSATASAAVEEYGDFQ